MTRREAPLPIAIVKWLNPRRGEKPLSMAPPNKTVVLQAFSCKRKDAEFFFAFAVGDGLRYTEVGNAAISRAQHYAKTRTATVCMIENIDRAYERVSALLIEMIPPSPLVVFACGDSRLYDAATAPLYNDPKIKLVAGDGVELRKLTATDRLNIRLQAKESLGQLARSNEREKRRPPRKSEVFYFAVPGRDRIRVSVALGDGPMSGGWTDMLARTTGGSSIAIVEVMRPTNSCDGRSSIESTKRLSEKYDGIVHYAFSEDIFNSIAAEFNAAGLCKARKPRLAGDWVPKVQLFLANPPKPESWS